MERRRRSRLVQVGGYRPLSKSRVILIRGILNIAIKIREISGGRRDIAGYQSIRRLFPVPKLRYAGIVFRRHVAVYDLCCDEESDIHLLSDRLRYGSVSEIEKLYKSLAKTYEIAMYNTGDWEEPTSINRALFWSRAEPSGPIGQWYTSVGTVPISGVLNYLRRWAADNKRVYVAITPGDPTEVNIATNPLCFLDFKYSGRNPVLGDFATLLTSTMFHGAYYAPRYHRQSYEFSEEIFDQYRGPDLCWSPAAFYNTRRRAGVRALLNYIWPVVGKIYQNRGLNHESEIVPFFLARMLLTIDPGAMTEKDRSLLFQEAVELFECGFRKYINARI